jgi:hypothetical protein
MPKASSGVRRAPEWPWFLSYVVGGFSLIAGLGVVVFAAVWEILAHRSNDHAQDS